MPLGAVEGSFGIYEKMGVKEYKHKNWAYGCVEHNNRMNMSKLKPKPRGPKSPGPLRSKMDPLAQ